MAQSLSVSDTARRRHRHPDRSTTRRRLPVVLADDSVLLREGIASLLEGKGFKIVGQSGTAEDLLLKVRSYKPDVAIVDIKMPPTHTGALTLDLPRERGSLVRSRRREDRRCDQETARWRRRPAHCPSQIPSCPWSLRLIDGGALVHCADSAAGTFSR